MELKRKPFQGVYNILRFNWHFYVIAAFLLGSILIFRHQMPETMQPLVLWIALFAITTILVSLVVSYYVYDVSNLYTLPWLRDLNNKKVLSVNAGFDETSEFIRTKFPESNMIICDFYDPKKHTEVSIKRARKAYPPSRETVPVTTHQLPFSNDSFHHTLAILSAHEIRDKNERIQFFKELNRVTTPSGKIYVTEHLRDFSNFSAYTIGFFHFHSKLSWKETFSAANLKIVEQVKTTPFITTFILQNDGNTF